MKYPNQTKPATLPEQPPFGRRVAKPTRGLTTALLVLVPAVGLGYVLYNGLLSGPWNVGRSAAVSPITRAPLPATLPSPTVTRGSLSVAGLAGHASIPAAVVTLPAVTGPLWQEFVAKNSMWQYTDPSGFAVEIPAGATIARATGSRLAWSVRSSAGTELAHIEASQTNAIKPAAEIAAQLALSADVRALSRDTSSSDAVVFSYMIGSAAGRTIVTSGMVYYILGTAGGIVPTFRVAR